jgi:hypothetical protein
MPLTRQTQRDRTSPELNSFDEAEQRLLDFVGSLILDVAHTHPRVRDFDVALWIARAAVGAKE